MPVAFPIFTLAFSLEIGTKRTSERKYFTANGVRNYA